MRVAGNVMRPLVRPCWTLDYHGWICTIPVGPRWNESERRWKFEHHYFTFAEYAEMKVNYRRGHDATSG